jgi:zinc/manganese transport system substrate-binding protein
MLKRTRIKTKNVHAYLAFTAGLLIIATGAVFAIIHYKSPPSSNDQKLKVVAAENFWGNIVSQIGGDHVDVTSFITDPNTDPHLYESDANDALALSKADIVIKNGLGYDDFMDSLLSVSPSSGHQVISVNNILGISGHNPNPHIWYDVPRIATVADAFEQALVTKDPKNTTSYAANLKKFKSSLQPILDTLETIKTKYPSAPVAYTERVPGYLLTAAGLDVKTPVGFANAVENGNDPSPNDTATMDMLMTTHSVRALLYNAQATSSVTEHVRNLANQASIPVIGVTETLPANEPTYQSWQLDQAKALLSALGK